jgi:hypothetical protein
MSVKLEAMRVIEDAEASKAPAAAAALIAAQAVAAAIASIEFLQTAKWWPKAGNTISLGFGEKEQVWRDITKTDAPSIKAGMQVKVERQKDDGASSIEDATLVKVDEGAGTCEVRYAEGGETEDGVAIDRLQERLVHEWAHNTYFTGTVKEEKEDGTFTVVVGTGELAKGDNVFVLTGGSAGTGAVYTANPQRESRGWRELELADGGKHWVRLTDLLRGGECVDVAARLGARRCAY